MSIAGFGRDEFESQLHKAVSASTPIRTIEHLKGRATDLDQIGRALLAPGRHVFIFGDRGVGKSSLAATAAYQFQSADRSPIFVAGSSDSTFASIIANIAIQALDRPRSETQKSTNKAEFSWKGLVLGGSRETSWSDLGKSILSVSDGFEVLNECCGRYSERTVVVIDEFDTIASETERAKFAELLKQFGDQSDRARVKLIFTGIGESVDELLGAHKSAHRQLLTLPLSRLIYQGRLDIVDEAVGSFGMTVDNDVNHRISQISDGFPYYVHLITEHCLWAAYDEPSVVSEVGWQQLSDGLQAAIRSIDAELRKPYERAVLHNRPDEYEDVVWATADHEDLFRSIDQIYRSYLGIIARRTGRPEIGRDRFSGFLRKLREPAYGGVLKLQDGRNGLYTYSEKILRGYVRMQAEANGISLIGEIAVPRQVMHVSNARNGNQGPTVPKGVKDRIR